MTVAELINELNKFDKNANVEIFSKADYSTILSKSLENYCIIGNKGQVVLMPEEPVESREKAFKEILEMAEAIEELTSSIYSRIDDIIETCREEV